MGLFLTSYLHIGDIIRFTYNDKLRTVVVLDCTDKSIRTWDFSQNAYRVFCHDRMVGVEIPNIPCKRIWLKDLPTVYKPTLLRLKSLKKTYQNDGYSVFIIEDKENSDLNELVAIKL